MLGVMILPLLTSLFIELFSSVSVQLREAYMSFGETIAVLMVCGNLPQIPRSLFDSAYPLPALIANNYGEMFSLPLYEAALMGCSVDTICSYFDVQYCVACSVV